MSNIQTWMAAIMGWRARDLSITEDFWRTDTCSPFLLDRCRQTYDPDHPAHGIRYWSQHSCMLLRRQVIVCGALWCPCSLWWYMLEAAPRLFQHGRSGKYCMLSVRRLSLQGAIFSVMLWSNLANSLGFVFLAPTLAPCNGRTCFAFRLLRNNLSS